MLVHYVINTYRFILLSINNSRNGRTLPISKFSILIGTIFIQRSTSYD